MVNRFKKGYTAEEAALIATGLNKYSSIQKAETELKTKSFDIDRARLEWESPYNEDYDPDTSCEDISKFENELENLSLAKEIYEALLEEVMLACEWSDYKSEMVEYYDRDYLASDRKPLSETVLEPYQISRRSPDDEWAYTPTIHSSVTKTSLAKWFNEHLPEKADLFDSSGSYKEINTGFKFNEERPKNKEQNQDQELTIRTDTSSLLDSLGIMAWLLSKKVNSFKRGDKPNSSQIKEKVNQVISSLELDQDDELKPKISNLNRDITTALNQLADKLPH